jgi:RNA polymerase sigma factor (TIGR02999 family)
VAATPGDVTGLLLAWNGGSEEARAKLIVLVYRELRRRARRALASERPDHTLQATALVHETYQKLVDQRRVQWQNRAQFYAVAAGLMRRILVDHARRHGAARRGGGAPRASLDDAAPSAGPPNLVEVIAVDDALVELTALDPDQARIVELRFFGGLSIEEAAQVVGVSRATAYRDWAMARAWLRRRLDDEGGSGAR